MEFKVEERVLHFKQPAGTSRGVYLTRTMWLIHLSDGDKQGVGECAPLPDLSSDAMPDEQYEAKLKEFCEAFCAKGEMDYDALRDYPSMLFGLETAWLNLQKGEKLFDTAGSDYEKQELKKLLSLQHMKVKKSTKITLTM